MSEITSDYGELARQAPAAAAEYLRRGIRDIDDYLGDGYAKAHPDLLAAYMKVAALDLATGVIAREINVGLEEIGSSIGDALIKINNAYRIINKIGECEVPPL